ncbi:MAG: hypothetical protein V2I38_09750, partial [Alcanivoracaceae bacterium]|nr:hypothetical protein [Alcanivoracaceae bacterium]
MRHTTLYALALSAAVAAVSLSGCNAGEDFGDVNIGGPIIDNTPQPAELPADDEEALEIELVVASEVAGVVRTSNVAHIKYECTGSVGEVKASGDTAYLARCATTARSVEFFVGGSGDTDPRISFGTAYLPMCTGRSEGSAGQTGCAGGSGFFQVTMADLVPRPVVAEGEPLPLSAPARRLASDAEVRNRVALLTALDVESDPLVLKVSSGASNLAGDAPNPVVTTDADFSTVDYSAFSAAWADWLAAINAAYSTSLALPPTAAQAEALAQAAMDRTRIGLFSLEHDGITYATTFPDEAPSNLNITVPFIVMPDGSVVGVGALFGVIGAGLTTEAAVDLLAIESGALLDDTLNIRRDGGGDWDIRSVLDPVGAALTFRGRIIGSAAYDNKTTAADRTDYKLDYPDAGVYTMVENDAARFSGSAFEQSQLIDLPFRIARTGSVGAVLHETVMTELPDFYQITIYKACVNPDIDAACAPIPEEEIGPGLNYPTEIDNDNCDETCEDDDVALVVTKEKPRGGPGYAFASGSFNLQFLEDGSIITDRAGECRPLVTVDPLVRETATGTIDEYRVGYVSRTLPDSSSANVLLFMASSASDGGTF